MWVNPVGALVEGLERDLRTYGFLPVGQGQIRERVSGSGARLARTSNLEIIAQGTLRSVSGRAITAILVAHGCQSNGRHSSGVKTGADVGWCTSSQGLRRRFGEVVTSL